jgi:hypothetical protein
LELSKQRRSDVLRESKQVLLEELEAIKSKSDISKKKFEDSLHASKKKLENELDLIEKKRRAQEEMRWSRPMSGFSSAASPSKLDGFSLSPSSSPSPSPTPPRRELFDTSGSPSKLIDGLSSVNSYGNSPLFSPPSTQFSSKTDRHRLTPDTGTPPTSERFSSSITPTPTSTTPTSTTLTPTTSPHTERYAKTEHSNLSPQLDRLSTQKYEAGTTSSWRLSDHKGIYDDFLK